MWGTINLILTKAARQKINNVLDMPGWKLRQNVRWQRSLYPPWHVAHASWKLIGEIFLWKWKELKQNKWAKTNKPNEFLRRIKFLVYVFVKLQLTEWADADEHCVALADSGDTQETIAADLDCGRRTFVSIPVALESFPNFPHSPTIAWFRCC